MDIISSPSFQIDLAPKDEYVKNIDILSGCLVCGEEHETDRCSVFDNFIHVPDTEVPYRAKLTLPENLRIDTLADTSKTVTATNFFPKGTQFGPFQAKQLYSLNPFANFPLKIFSGSESILPDCYLDTTNEEYCNWMCYILPAQNIEEQNLICYQLKEEIFFSAVRDIPSGEQLKVWYSPCYAAKMGVKIFPPKVTVTLTDLLKDSEEIQKVAEKLPACKLGAEQKQSWCCRMCGAIENNVVTFARHLQNHYIKMLSTSYVCDICNEGFGSEKCLTKHRKISHTVFTQSKSISNENKLDIPSTKVDDILAEDACLPLPHIDQLMNEALSETDHSSLLMLDQLNLNENQQLALYSDLNDVDTLRAILCDDNTKASKTAQEKSIADFSLDFVENGHNAKSHVCDICNKSFQTLQYLCRHLKKHTGEYTCLQCLVVFTRKENFQKHPCFVSDKTFNCSYCPKSFLQKKYLIRHMGKHTGKYACALCGKHYASLVERNHHNCPFVPSAQKKVYACEMCNKKFFRELYLRKHVRNCHKELINTSSTSNEVKEVICEICAEKFKNMCTLKQHKLQHSEPQHKCVICSKKFHRRDVLSNHLLSHGSPQVPCPICGKKLKTKKCLKMHMLQHGGEKPYTCENCGKKFLQRTNMLRHQETHAGGSIFNCNFCDKTFVSKFSLKAHEENHHLEINDYHCIKCNKSFSKRYLLKKHNMHYHLDHVYACPYCPRVFKHRNSIRRHLHQAHANCKAEWNDPVVISSFLIEDKNVRSKQQTDVISENIPIVSTNVVESEQQIMLGKNAFILDDGTIVQPQDEGNIMIYVLNQQLPKQ